MKNIKMFFSLRKIRMAIGIPCLVGLSGILLYVVYDKILKYVPIEYAKEISVYVLYGILGLLVFSLYLMVVYKLGYSKHNSVEEAYNKEHATYFIDQYMSDTYYKKLLEIRAEGYVASREELRDFLIEFYARDCKDTIFTKYNKNVVYWTKVAKEFVKILNFGI